MRWKELFFWTVFEFSFVTSKFVTVGTFYVSELNDKNRITRPLYGVVLMLIKNDCTQ